MPGGGGGRSDCTSCERGALLVPLLHDIRSARESHNIRFVPLPRS